MSDYPIKSTARIFHDVDGNEVTLYQLIRRHPEWAKNRILDLETEKAAIWQEAAEIAEKLHDEYVEKEQFKWPEMRTEAATALGEIQAIFEAKSRGESPDKEE